MKSFGIRFVAILGAALFVLGLFLFSTLEHEQNGPEIIFIIDHSSSVANRPPCWFKIDSIGVKNKIFSIDSSTVLEANLRMVVQDPKIEMCDGRVEIYAPDFELSPSETKQEISIPLADSTHTVQWILKPKRMGDFPVIVSTLSSSQSVDVSVTNALGLKPFQVELLSYFSTFGGPALSLPWWYETIKKRKDEKKKEQTQDDEIKNLREQVAQLKKKANVKKR